MNLAHGKFLRIGLFVVALSFALPIFAAAQISIGIRIGAPPPPRVVAYRPASPGPDFIWVEGYWYPVGKHYRWHDGFWAQPPYFGARWVAPRHDGERFFEGFWDGDHGRVDREHPWTPDRERAFRERERERDHDRDRDWDRKHEREEHDRDRDRDHEREHHDRDEDRDR